MLLTAFACQKNGDRHGGQGEGSETESGCQSQAWPHDAERDDVLLLDISHDETRTGDVSIDQTVCSERGNIIHRICG